MAWRESAWVIPLDKYRAMSKSEAEGRAMLLSLLGRVKRWALSSLKRQVFTTQTVSDPVRWLKVS